MLCENITLTNQDYSCSGPYNKETNTFNGFCKIYYTNGDYFEGFLVNSKKQGLGKYIWKNKIELEEQNIIITDKVYEGEFFNDMKNGDGIIKQTVLFLNNMYKSYCLYNVICSDDNISYISCEQYINLSYDLMYLDKKIFGDFDYNGLSNGFNDETKYYVNGKVKYTIFSSHKHGKKINLNKIIFGDYIIEITEEKKLNAKIIYSGKITSNDYVYNGNFIASITNNLLHIELVHFGNLIKIKNLSYIPLGIAGCKIDVKIQDLENLIFEGKFINNELYQGYVYYSKNNKQYKIEIKNGFIYDTFDVIDMNFKFKNKLYSKKNSLDEFWIVKKAKFMSGKICFCDINITIDSNYNRQFVHYVGEVSLVNMPCFRDIYMFFGNGELQINENKYIGEFENGLLKSGTIVYSNGDIYCGECLYFSNYSDSNSNDSRETLYEYLHFNKIVSVIKKHGNGKLKKGDGYVFEGKWYRDNPSGLNKIKSFGYDILETYKNWISS